MKVKDKSVKTPAPVAPVKKGKGKAEPAVKPPEKTTAVAVRKKNAPVVKAEVMPSTPKPPRIFDRGGVSGEVDGSDLSTPKLNIVQSVGPLSEDFDPGSILFNKEVVLIEALDDPKEWTPPLEITILSARKQFQEVKDYDSDEMGEVVDTFEEVEARGGWIDWRDDEKPPWRPMLTALVLIKAPTDAAKERFSLVGPDGETYELAIWVMAGTSYTRAAKGIITASKYALFDKATDKAVLNHGKWDLSVRREKLGTNLVFVPRLRLRGKHDADFIAFTDSLL